MGIPASRWFVGQECPTYVSGSDRALASQAQVWWIQAECCRNLAGKQIARNGG